MNPIDEVRQNIEQNQPLEPMQAQSLLEAYDTAQEELERLQTRIGDLEFHYEVFEHLMSDRKLMIDKFTELGLEILSVPDQSKGSWGWAWRWRGGEPHTGYERSIYALIDAVETLLKDVEN